LPPRPSRPAEEQSGQRRAKTGPPRKTVSGSRHSDVKMEKEPDVADTKVDGVLGRVTSGIYILSVGSGDRATGMLTSWVMQAGFDPPMVSVAVKTGRYVCDWLTNGEP